MEREADHGEASEVHRRVQDTKERWKEVCSFDFEALITELVGSAPDSNFLCRLLQLRQNASDVAQGCADFSSDSTDRNHSFAPDPRRASPSLRPGLKFSVHTGPSTPSTTLTKKMPSESLQSSVEPQSPAEQGLSRSTVAAGDATICTSTSDSVTGNEQLCPRQTNAAPSVVA